MICKSCQRAGQVPSKPTEEFELLRTQQELDTYRRACHALCPGYGQCNCQHRNPR